MATQEFYTLITMVGQAKIANSVALGRTIELSEIAVSDWDGDPTQEQTELHNEVYRGPLNSIAAQNADNPNWITAEAVLPQDIGGWYVREVGIYDADGDLFAVAKYPATYKPRLDGGAGKDLYIKTILEVSNASAVVLKVDPAVVIASREYVDRQRVYFETIQEAQKADLSEAHRVIITSMSDAPFSCVADLLASEYPDIMKFRDAIGRWWVTDVVYVTGVTELTLPNTGKFKITGQITYKGSEHIRSLLTINVPGTKAIYITVSELILDGGNKSNQGLNIVSDDNIACSVAINNCYISNIQRSIAHTGGSGIRLYGAFRRIDIDKPVVQSITMQEGAGISGVQGIAGISISVARVENQSPPTINITNGIIRNVYSLDSDFFMDQDGIAILAGAYSDFMISPVVNISNMRLENTLGRIIKSQCRKTHISNIEYSQNRSGTSNTRVRAFDMQYGGGSVRHCILRIQNGIWAFNSIVHTTNRDKFKSPTIVEDVEIFGDSAANSLFTTFRNTDTYPETSAAGGRIEGCYIESCNHLLEADGGGPNPGHVTMRNVYGGCKYALVMSGGIPIEIISCGNLNGIARLDSIDLQTMMSRKPTDRHDNLANISSRYLEGVEDPVNTVGSISTEETTRGGMKMIGVALSDPSTRPESSVKEMTQFAWNQRAFVILSSDRGGKHWAIFSMDINNMSVIQQGDGVSFVADRDSQLPETTNLWMENGIVWVSNTKSGITEYLNFTIFSGRLY